MPRPAAADPPAADPASPVPNGGAAATLSAAGIGCAAFGLAVVLSESVTPVHDALDVHHNVGPLSGKAICAVAIWALAWAVLHTCLRRRTVNLGRWLTLTIALVAAGVVLTFPPVYTLFAAK